MPEYAALIFDCDGTLADTMSAHYIAWSQTLSRYGVEFTEERFYAMGGIPTHRIVKTLSDESGLALDAQAVGDEKEQCFHTLMDERPGLLLPVEPVVSIAQSHRGRLPMAVATGSPRWSATKTLDAIGVLDWFDHLVCSDDVNRHKPDPDVFLEAARRLNVAPESCCVYEDTAPGIEGARRAGMDVVDIRSLLFG